MTIGEYILTKKSVDYQFILNGKQVYVYSNIVGYTIEKIEKHINDNIGSFSFHEDIDILNKPHSDYYIKPNIEINEKTKFVYGISDELYSDMQLEIRNIKINEFLC